MTPSPAPRISQQRALRLALGPGFSLTGPSERVLRTAMPAGACAPRRPIAVR